MKYKLLKSALIGVISIVSCLGNFANAGLVIDNGFDSTVQDGASLSNYFWTRDGREMGWRTWDDFTINTDTSLSSASFLFKNSSNSPSEFLFDIVYDSQNDLGDTVYSSIFSLADVSVTQIDSQWAQFDVLLPSVSLATGNYWLSFSAGDAYLAGSKVGGFGQSMIQIDRKGLVQYEYQENYIPFQLHSSPVDVPEPSTLAIFALGIFGLAAPRFKKAKT